MSKWSISLMVALASAMVNQAASQGLPATHNPKMDIYLSPSNNDRISPEKNALINPMFNWRINPLKNKKINPDENININPVYRPELNPNFNEMINPMLHSYLHPGNPGWSGLFMFNKSDDLIGYISKPTAEVLLCFDLKGNWTCYYVRTESGTYNLFDTEGEWTGNYLCYDEKVGYNQFNKDGTWTGVHIK